MTTRTRTRTETPQDQEQPADAAPLTPELARELKIRTAPGWRPEAGAVLTGTVVKMYARRVAAIGNQPERNILVMVMDTGDTDQFTAVHVLHSVLNAAISAIKPSPGDQLTIAYHGKVKSKDPAKPGYHNYTVIDPNAVEVPFSWDELGDVAAF